MHDSMDFATDLQKRIVSYSENVLKKNTFVNFYKDYYDNNPLFLEF